MEIRSFVAGELGNSTCLLPEAGLAAAIDPMRECRSSPPSAGALKHVVLS